MKKFVLMVMGLLFLTVGASAYRVNIEAPDTLSVGKPLIVNGTTTFGIGTPIDVVLYYQLTTTTEIKRKIVYVQSDNTFRTVFDTTGLKTGMYKVEVPTNGMGGDSITMRVVYLVDRSDELQLTSSSNQSFSGTISLSGTIKGDENSGVQIEVTGPGNAVVFGPRYINTDYQGSFAADVPITEPGEYEVSFTDADGYIGKRIITVIGPQYLTTVTTSAYTKISIVSAHAKSSRENPVYFAIKTGYGQVNIHTSSSVDWVLEYVDSKGIIRMINNEGEQYPERVELNGEGKTIYIKVYPFRYTVNSEVFVYAENATSIVQSPPVPQPFAAGTPPSTEETPVPLMLPVMGLAAAAIVFSARYRQ